MKIPKQLAEMRDLHRASIRHHEHVEAHAADLADITNALIDQVASVVGIELLEREEDRLEDLIVHETTDKEFENGLASVLRSILRRRATTKGKQPNG